MFGLRRRVRIACEPIPWSTQGDQKIKEKKQPISEPPFLAKKSKILEKRAPKGLQKGEGISGVAPLGAPLEPQADFDSKSEPTAPPKCSQGPKNASKVTPEGPKMILKVTLKVHSLGALTLDRRFEPRPGGLREAH